MINSEYLTNVFIQRFIIALIIQTAIKAILYFTPLHNTTLYDHFYWNNIIGRSMFISLLSCFAKVTYLGVFLYSFYFFSLSINIALNLFKYRKYPDMFNPYVIWAKGIAALKAENPDLTGKEDTHEKSQNSDTI